jgi:hypothetical protein
MPREEINLHIYHEIHPGICRLQKPLKIAQSCTKKIIPKNVRGSFERRSSPGKNQKQNTSHTSIDVKIFPNTSIV